MYKQKIKIMEWYESKHFNKTEISRKIGMNHNTFVAKVNNSNRNKLLQVDIEKLNNLKEEIIKNMQNGTF